MRRAVTFLTGVAVAVGVAGAAEGVSRSQRALGSMVQLAVDVAETGRGTIVVVGNVDRYGPR